MTISGTNTLCLGMTATLTANGGVTYTWQPGNINTANAAVSPTTSTQYTVYATTASSCLAVNAFSLTVFSCVGVNDFSVAEHMKLYPNPSDGRITIELTRETNIIMTNSLGAIVLKTKLNEGENLLELNVDPGIYFICGQNESVKWQKKIIVSK